MVLHRGFAQHELTGNFLVRQTVADQVGNMALANVAQKYKDNRVDYFFSHLDQAVAAHGAIFAFGAGADDQTNPSTDNGNVIGKAKAYVNGGGTLACP